MPKNVTMEAIEDLFNDTLDKKFDEKLGPVIKTQREHSTALEELLLDKKKRGENQQVHDYRVENLEGWAGKAGKKLDIKFEV
jgi:hypothetical protein